MKIDFNLVPITFEPPLLGVACLVIVNQPKKKYSYRLACCLREITGY